MTRYGGERQGRVRVRSDLFRPRKSVAIRVAGVDSAASAAIQMGGGKKGGSRDRVLAHSRMAQALRFLRRRRWRGGGRPAPAPRQGGAS